MSLRYLELAFTPSVRDAQRRAYGRARPPGPDSPDDALGPEETAFIAARDSFYLSTVSETGWPYVQHRGGPVGFLRVLDGGRALAFADLSGNRQLLSAGNLSAAGHDRVALFLMDYPHRERLKINGHARVIDARDDPALAATLPIPGPPAALERIFRIEVVSFDWNCPQHITPRYTREEVETAVAPLRARLAELEARLSDPPK